MSFILGISLGLEGDSVGPPAGSGGGGGDAPPITDNLLVYYNPDVDVYSDNIGTPAVDGDNIRQFNDQSGNANTLTQTQANAQPIYNTTQLGNGNAAISAVNDWFYFTNDLSLDNSTSWTWYVVYEKTNTTAINYSYFLGAGGGYPRSEFRSNLIQIRGTSGSGRYVSYNDNGSLKVVAITVDRSANQFKIYANGAYIGASVSQVTNWAVDIGRLFGSSNYVTYFGNNMFYTAAHDATQVAEVSDWLNEKYKLYNQPLPITDNLELYVNPDKDVYSDDIGTLAVDGDNIRQIRDQSTTPILLNQDTASAQYVFKNDVLGTGNSGLWISSSTEFMELDNTITIPGATKSITFYAVYNRINNGAINYMYGSSSGNFDRILQFGNSEIYFQDSNSVQTNATSSIELSTTVIKTYVLNTSTDTLTTYLNGTVVDTVTQSKTWGDFDFKRFWGENGFSGYVGNTILYSDAHDATQVGEITDWLNTKYQIY